MIGVCGETESKRDRSNIIVLVFPTYSFISSSTRRQICEYVVAGLQAFLHFRGTFVSTH